MMVPVRDALEDFNKRTVYARMWVNETPTPVEVKYQDQWMMFRNLEDLPMNVKLLRLGRLRSPAGLEDYEKQHGVEVSNDGYEWETIDKEASEAFQIFQLLDPSFVLPGAEIEGSSDQSKPKILEGNYWIESLQLPHHALTIFAKENERRRWLRLTIFGTRLLTIEQQDFPPFEDIVKLTFSSSGWLAPRGIFYGVH